MVLKYHLWQVNFMKKIKVAIIGYGNRGMIYGSFIQERMDQFQVVAVVEFIKDKLAKAKNDFNLNDNQLYQDADAFFKDKLKVDLLIVSSMDKYHYLQTVTALNQNMNVLLEKPIALTLNECNTIADLAKQKKKYVVVCHVLRYSSFYCKIKELIENGRVGEVVHINQAENVGYWHQAHSYVRGNWRKKEETGPMILAKCSHDLDILYWLINKPCVRLSSFGSLKHFKKENQPKGAASRCFDCIKKEDCPFNCYNFYLKDGREWARQLVGDDLSDENIKVFLKTSDYGKCVYECDNDVVDHQVVNMEFEGNVTASLSMEAFSRYCYREIHVYGTKGDITGDFEKRIITLNDYINGQEVIDLNEITDDFSGHGGGDKVMFFEFVDLLVNKRKAKNLTLIEDSIMSHVMAFASEKSRLNKGEVVEIEQKNKMA